MCRLGKLRSGLLWRQSHVLRGIMADRARPRSTQGSTLAHPPTLGCCAQPSNMVPNSESPWWPPGGLSCLRYRALMHGFA